MATYIRLTDYKDSDSKEQEFFKNENRYEPTHPHFFSFPSSSLGMHTYTRGINNGQK